MKVAIIRPPMERGEYFSPEAFIPPLGIGYVSSFLHAKGIQTVIIDAVIENLDIHQTVRRILDEDVDVAGISAITSEVLAARSLARAVKTAAPTVRTVLGGVHAIALPVETMEAYPEFDFLVSGEGELTSWELLQCLRDGTAPTDVAGLVWRRNGEIVSNEDRPWIENLDDLPFPSWDRYPGTFPCYFVLSSRGCPFSCNFCMRVLGNRVRQRSPKNVVEEVEWILREFHPKRLIFQDETFTLNRTRTEALLDLMIQRNIPKKVKWVIQTRVDCVDPAILRHLRKAGCYRIEFGIESGNPQILKEMKKGFDLDRARDAVKEAKDAGLFVSCSFIFGHPNETKKTVRQTIRFCQKLNPDHATFGIMVPYPRTEIATLVANQQKGYVKGPTSWQDFTRFSKHGLELESLGYREMEKLQVEAYLRYFLFNFRFVSMAKYLWNHRVQIAVFLKKLLPRKESSG